METLIMGLVALSAAVFVRREDAFTFRWQPTQSTWAAVGAGMVAFILSALLLLFPYGSEWAHAIHYVGIYAICGFVLPWGYAILVEKNGLPSMGVTPERWRLSRPEMQRLSFGAVQAAGSCQRRPSVPPLPSGISARRFPGSKRCDPHLPSLPQFGGQGSRRRH